MGAIFKPQAYRKLFSFFLTFVLAVVLLLPDFLFVRGENWPNTLLYTAEETTSDTVPKDKEISLSFLTLWVASKRTE